MIGLLTHQTDWKKIKRISNAPGLFRLKFSRRIICSCFDIIYSIDHEVLDRICKNILPRIHHQVKELTVEQHSMERVLDTIIYPQLYSLSLVDFQEEVLLKYLTGKVVYFY
jgi:hypothetical protein